MSPISPAKAAIATGLVIGGWHALWAALVAAGLAQALLDLIMRLHFMRLDINIAPFEFSTAAQLVLITFAIGGVFGLVFASV